MTMSDLVRMPTLFDPVFAWEDTSVVGSHVGLGCSSNSRFFVCSFWDATTGVAAFDSFGVRVWDSGPLLNATAYASAPLILDDESTVVADDAVVARFDAAGSVMWSTPTSGGLPISPVITDNGHILLATDNGPVSTYRLSDGDARDALRLSGDAGDPITFSTANTPCVNGNRVYILTEPDTHASREGRLWAIDVHEDGTMESAWFYTYAATSGGSPLRIGDTIYFDGAGVSPDEPSSPHLFAVRDLGSTWEEVWTVPIDWTMRVSLARDPRGGFWGWTVGSSEVRRYSEADGSVIQLFDIDDMIGEFGEHRPQSVLSISNGSSGPVIVFRAAGLWAQGYIVGVEVGADANLLWKYPFSEDSWAQFPIIESETGGLVVLVATARDGIRAIKSGPTSGNPVGAVPDGKVVSGAPLIVARADGDTITLTWGEACSASATDFGVYEGAIGDYSSHQARLCSTGGATSVTITPASTDAYYLVAPNDGQREGLLGDDSGGAGRPQGASPCFVREAAPCQ